MIKFFTIFVATLLVVLLSSSNSFAASITKVKNGKVLIVLDGATPQQGEKWFALDGAGKKKAIITIDKVTGEKAIGTITKGTAEVGYNLQSTDGKKSASSGAAGGRYNSQFGIGVLGGYSMDSMTVKLGTGETLNLAGSGFGAQLIGDLYLTSSISILAFVGLETFGVTGSIGSNRKYSTDISYLVFGGIARYVYWLNNFGLWGGIGGSLASPSNPSSNAVTTSSIVTTNMIHFAGGLDYALSSKMYIPLRVQYSILPPSDTVSASMISIQAGLVYGF